MTLEPIHLRQYRCEPGPARAYAQELRALARAAGEAEDAYAVGFDLDRREFEGAAGDSFRARCRSRMTVAAELSLNLARLSEAAGEAARDARDIAVQLDEIVAIAHAGGLVVSGDAIHPPDGSVRREDTPALVQGWQAWDQVTSRHAAVDASYHRSIDDWIQSIARYGYGEWARRSVPDGPWVADTRHDTRVEPPHDPVMPDRIPPQQDRAPSPHALPGGRAAHPDDARFDADSRAQWVEGHRNKDGEWVHASWQPFGHDGHGGILGTVDSPHAGEHPSGATVAHWVDGRWEPVAPGFHPPPIA